MAMAATKMVVAKNKVIVSNASLTSDDFLKGSRFGLGD